MGLPSSRYRGHCQVSGYVRCGFAYISPYTLRRGQPSPRGGYPSASPHCLPTTGSVRALHHASSEESAGFRLLALPGSVWSVFRRYGNINPLSIDYACRPRLRSRLTLGGLACPRNPWSIGGRASHSSFATHACILTRAASTAGSPRCFTRCATLSYPSQQAGMSRLRRRA